MSNQKLIRGKEINDSGVFQIDYIHFMPFDPQYGLPAEQLEDGFIIDVDIPEELPYQRGFNSVLYFNPLESLLWHEYVERPLTPEEQAEVQAEKIDLLLELQLASQGVI